MRKYVVMTAAAALLTLAGCGKSASEKEAEACAAKAAAAVIATDHADTLALQQSILDAKVQQSQYAVKGDSAAVKAFDEAFEAYLKEHDNALWQQIFE